MNIRSFLAFVLIFALVIGTIGAPMTPAEPIVPATPTPALAEVAAVTPPSTCVENEKTAVITAFLRDDTSGVLLVTLEFNFDSENKVTTQIHPDFLGDWLGQVMTAISSGTQSTAFYVCVDGEPMLQRLEVSPFPPIDLTRLA